LCGGRWRDPGRYVGPGESGRAAKRAGRTLSQAEPRSGRADSAEILLTRVHAGREKRTCGRHSRE